MIPIQHHPRHYWRTNDAADLAFGEAGPDAPTHIKCYNLHDSLNRGEIVNVPVGEVGLMAKAYFGTRKLGWTGDAYRFGIYRRARSIGSAEIVILVSHGGGMEAYSLSDLVAVQTWIYLVENLSEEMLWNVCYEIMEAHRSVRDEAHRVTLRLFLEGRLKKRKRGNRFYAEVLPRRTPQAVLISARD